jgi:hypothetical protein
MYFGSLNEILACLLYIINVVRFQFEIQTLLFYFIQTKSFGTCLESQISCIQM